MERFVQEQAGGSAGAGAMTNRQLQAVRQALEDAQSGAREAGPLAAVLARNQLPALTTALIEALPIPSLKLLRRGGNKSGRPSAAAAAAAGTAEEALPPPVIDMADALLAAARFCRAHGHGKAADAVTHSVAAALERNAASYDRELTGHIDLVDLPDLRRVSLNSSRIDVLCWLAELFEAPETLKVLSFHGRRALRLTLGRVCDIIDRFLADRSLESRFDTVAVMMELDELVVSVDRLLDPEASRREGGAVFLGDRDADVVTRLGTSLRQLLQVLTRLIRNAGRKADVNIDLALGLIRQVERLLLLTTSLEERLPDTVFVPITRQAMEDATRTLLELEIIGRPEADRLARTLRAALSTVSQRRLARLDER